MLWSLVKVDIDVVCKISPALEPSPDALAILVLSPSATSSKVIIIAVLDFQGIGDRDRRLMTSIHYGAVQSSTQLARAHGGQYRTGGDNSMSHGSHTYWFLHSPSSTSSLTYRVGLMSLDGSTVKLLGSSSTVSSYMYLQEVKG